MRRILISVALSVTLSASAARAAEPISWEEADKHIGEEATVEGRVMGVHCSPLSCLLAFDPSFNRFTVVVQARNFDVFKPDELDNQFSGRRVLVHGTITMNDNKPEIEVGKAEDLRIATNKKKEREAEQRDAAQAQADVLDRLADILDRVNDLTERMAATQERMEALLAQLEDRTSQLAALQAAAQPGPPPPQSYGEPQPRPAFEALRTIKRGMSRNEVQRLVGQPVSVEPAGNGWETWYYGYGRSVSFDSRGRAASLSGFPKP